MAIVELISTASHPKAEILAQQEPKQRQARPIEQQMIEAQMHPVRAEQPPPLALLQCAALVAQRLAPVCAAGEQQAGTASAPSKAQPRRPSQLSRR